MAKTMATANANPSEAKHELPIGVSTLGIIADGYAYADKYRASTRRSP